MIKKLLFAVLLLCSFAAQAGATQDWNNEFMRLNNIPKSKMNNDENMTQYFKIISQSGGYKLPGAIAPVAVLKQPVPAVSVPQNATAKQLIKTIIDAAAALDKL